MHLKTMTEIELIQGLRKSSTAAYKQLFLDYYTMIRRFLSRMLGDDEQAKDIAQNIFLKVWLNRESLDESKSIKSYIYVLAKNEALNHIKRNSRVTRMDGASDISDGNDVQISTEYNETFNIIRQRVESMPERRREVFRLSRMEHLSNKEISEMLNLSVRTVEKHIELALKDIRKTIGS